MPGALWVAGERIDEAEIYGELLDLEGRRVEADVFLTAAGHCFSLNLQTRDRFATTSVLASDASNLTPAQIMDGADYEPPFVVNDDSITSELVDALLVGRLVWSALAASLVEQVVGDGGLP